MGGSEASISKPSKPKVVLLHGLLRGTGSMRSLARRVQSLTGCEVFSIAYPSHQAVKSPRLPGISLQPPLERIALLKGIAPCP